MRFVGTALVAGTIGVFSVLTGGELIRAGTGRSGENAPTQKIQKGTFRYERFHDVIGLKVENVDGEKIGTINDLIVDAKSGRPKYVIVKSGGSLLTRRRLILVPVSAIAITTAKAGVSAIDITKQHWNHAPEFTRKQLPTLAQGNKAQQIDHFFDRTVRVVQTNQTTVRSAQISPTRRAAKSAIVPEPNRSYRLASELFGREVVTREGTNYGKISDLMMDSAGEKPMLAIISSHSPSAGEKFAVPLRMLTGTTEEEVIINAGRADFERAQQFQPENLATIASGDAREIFRYQR